MTAELRRLASSSFVGGLSPDPEGQIVGEVRRGYQHNSVPLTRRCTEGRQHRYEPTPHPDWRPVVCRHCGDERGPVRCWFYECGEDADLYFERWVTHTPNVYDLLRGERSVTRVDRDQGTCDWCIERHRRNDAYLELRGRRDTQEYHSLLTARERQAERDGIRQEKEEQWQRAREQRQETARQRDLLRQGHRTLTAIRRHLAGPVSSRPPESRPARTSPTS